MEEKDNRPYAAPANVIAVLKRIRSRNLPENINNDFLRVVQVPETVFGRIIQALRFLNLIHEDGRPTDNLKALSGAREIDYQQILASVVREAYKDEFAMIDPARDTQGHIIDCFRPYQPRSQTSRMVTLFLGICREAGIPVLDAPRERQMSQPASPKQQKTGKRTIPARTSQTTGWQPIVSQSAPSVCHAFINGVLFGVTEQDIGLLGEDEFNEVWGALGKIARARARSKMQATSEKDLVIEDEPE